MNSLRQAWAALPPRLKILEPATFSAGEWSLLERLHACFNDREAHTHLPLPIASFRDEARDEIFDLAKRFGDVRTDQAQEGRVGAEAANSPAGAMAIYAQLYNADVVEHSWQLRFLLEADKLKSVDRSCLLADGSRPETSAEHSWHLALMAITLAFVGTVVSETVGANKGIGKLMLDAQSAFQVPIVFAGLLVLAFLGILLYAMTAIIEQRFTGWAFRGQANR